MWYQRSPSWHGKFPQWHLASFSGKLRVDAYAGFEPLYLSSNPRGSAAIEQISCMAHATRHFFDVYAALNSPLAKEAIDRIRGLCQMEDHIDGSSPEKRLAARVNTPCCCSTNRTAG